MAKRREFSRIAYRHSTPTLRTGKETPIRLKRFKNTGSEVGSGPRWQRGYAAACRAAPWGFESSPRHHLSLAFRGCFADLLRSNPPSGISLVLNVNCQLILGTNHEYCSLSDCDVPPEVQRQRPRRRPDLPILMSGPRVHLAFDELDYPWSATESLLYYQKDLVLLNHIPQDVEH